MEFRILGPLEVIEDGQPLALGGTKQRALLACLLLRANQVVSADRLIEELWPGAAPRTAAKTIQVYVWRLRKELGEGRVVTRPPGYLVRVGPSEFDLFRFEELLEKARDLDRMHAAEPLREALALWRGPPLADLSYEAFAQTEIARLEELRLAALEERIEADLATGRNAELVGELEALVRRHPLRERLRGQLMLALYRSGRQAEALEVYQAARRTLVDELGLEPGAALQRLEKAILQQDRSLDVEELPSGAVTFLFTDIEGSTALVKRLRSRYGEVLAEHARLLREAFTTHAGREVDTQGDSFFVAFHTARDAVLAAVAAQRALAEQEWPDGTEIRVRMGIHTGQAAISENRYLGLSVHRAARIGAAGHGGQILLSQATQTLLEDEEEDLADVILEDLGSHRLKDLDRPVRLYQAVAPGLRRDFPALRAVGPVAPAAEEAPSLAEASEGERAIVTVSLGERGIGDLLTLAGPLATSERSRELIVARILEAGAQHALAEATADLRRERDARIDPEVHARVAAFTSAQPGVDVLRLASQQDVDLLLVDMSLETLAGDLFRTSIGDVLRGAPCDVALVVGREAPPGLGPERAVLVPFGAAEHDWAALELGSWLARAHDAPLRLVGALSGGPDGRDASRLLADASILVQRLTGVVAEPLLARPGGQELLRAGEDAGALVIGLSDRWSKEGLGEVRRAIAAAARAPTLFVRRGPRPGGLAPSETRTRFTWSLGAATG
jgi:DNA-binding SARP family transcriptional activator